jgi:SNF2 family DNA or RNA helicase
VQDLLPLLKGELRHHQLQGVRWLASMFHDKLVGVLADEPAEERLVSGRV